MDSPIYLKCHPHRCFHSYRASDVHSWIRNTAFEREHNRFQMPPSRNKAAWELVSLSAKETVLAAGTSATLLGYAELGIVHSHQCWFTALDAYGLKTLGAFSIDNSTGRSCYDLWRLRMEGMTIDQMERYREENVVGFIMNVTDY